MDDLNRSDEAPAAHAFVYHSSGDEAAAGWAVNRQAVLALAPRFPRGVPPVAAVTTDARTPRPPGVFWSLRSPNGIVVAVRARDFRDRKAARRDARSLGLRADELEAVPVSGDDGRWAWWLTLNSQVVLVAAHLVSASKVGHAARQAIAGLKSAAAPSATARKTARTGE